MTSSTASDLTEEGSPTSPSPSTVASSDATTHSSSTTTTDVMMTSTHNSTLTTNATLLTTPVNHDAAILAGHVVAIVLFTAAMLAAVVCIYCYYKGKLNTRRFHLVSRFKRGRTGSVTSSRHPLENEDDDEDEYHDDVSPRSLPRDDAELFTIGDVEEEGGPGRGRGRGGRRREEREEEEGDSKRNSHATMDEDYFYDEVFGESAFEDEATNTALKELTLGSSGEEDLPDLVFKDNP